MADHCKSHEEFTKLMTRLDERTKWLVKDRLESRDKIDEHIESSEGFRTQVGVNSNFRVITQRIFIGLVVGIFSALVLMGVKYFLI